MLLAVLHLGQCHHTRMEITGPSPANPTTGTYGLRITGVLIDKSTQRAEGIKSNMDGTIIENSVIHSSLELLTLRTASTEIIPCMMEDLGELHLHERR